MQHLLLVDETFDLNFTQEYYLSIQLCLDGFSFCIRDGLQNKYIYLFHKELSGDPRFLPKKLSDIYEEFDILKADFKTTRIICSYPGKSTLIPEAFFSDKYAVDQYQLIQELEKGEELYHLPMKKYRSVLQMVIPKKVRTFLQEKHPGVIFENDTTIFLNQYMHKEGDAPLLLIQLYKSQVTICMVDETIRFYNSFYYVNENDLLFYILNVSKSLDQTNYKVVLNGMVNKRSVIYHRLRQYFKDVMVVGRNPDVYYSYLFDQLPDARFVNLLNSNL